MRLFKILLYSLIFSYSSLFSYTSISVKPEVINSKSDYYNGSCAYVGDGYARSVYENWYNDLNTDYSSCTPSSYYDNYSELLSLNSNPDFVFSSSSSSTEYEYTHCETNGLEGINGSLYAIGKYKNSFQCSFTFIGTCPTSTIYNDSTGQCESIPDSDSDGIPDKCDKDFPDYANLDCDDDDIPNNSDTDVDGDGIPNDYDTDNEIPASSETSPTCYELQDIAEAKCNYSHQWECVNANPDYVIKDLCLSPRSPCEEALEVLKRNCDSSTHQLDGNCYDNGLDITLNTLKCVLKDDPPPECDRNWHEVLNTSTNECECAPGYSYNTFGDCWKSSIDSNSTDDEIAEDERQQDLNNEAKTEEEEEKKQQQSDNNSTSSSLTLDNSRNDTLKGIREDLAETNDLLSEMNDKLDNDGNGTLNINNDDRRDDLLTEIRDFLSSDNNESSGSLDFLSDSVGAILNKYTVDLTQGGCGSISTVGGVILGQNVVFLSQDIINQMPIEYMRNIIVFLFTISALILVFRGV